MIGPITMWNYVRLQIRKFAKEREFDAKERKLAKLWRRKEELDQMIRKAEEMIAKKPVGSGYDTTPSISPVSRKGSGQPAVTVDDHSIEVPKAHQGHLG